MKETVRTVAIYLFAAALAVLCLFAAASASGCGGYVVHEPESPVLEQSGDSSSGSSSDSPTEVMYINSNVIVQGGTTTYYEYTGQIAAVNVTAYVPDTSEIYINMPTTDNEFEFETGATYIVEITFNSDYKFTEIGAWSASAQSVWGSFEIAAGICKIEITYATEYLIISLGSAGESVDLDFTISVYQTSDSYSASPGYIVDYELSYLERYILVRDYYLAIEDPAERLVLYRADTVAQSYLGNYYTTLYNYLSTLTS